MNEEATIPMLIICSSKTLCTTHRIWLKIIPSQHKWYQNV